MPKFVYIAHQIGGDVSENVKRVLEICKEVHTKDILPLAPYLTALQYLDDNLPEERELGILTNREFFTKKVIDEVWICGPRISNGMLEEIKLSLEHNIPIKCFNPELEKELNKIIEKF